jgi:hypothetical protein
MNIGGKDISEIDLNYFRRANSFYDIPSHLILENEVDSDFIVRTFRG